MRNKKATNKRQRSLVIVPTYNEIENIPQLLDAILSQPAALDVLVVDDSSPDGTGDYVSQRAQDDVRVKLLSRSGKLGLGTAYLAGFERALNQGYRYAITMDADFSHNPRYLPELLTLMEQRDVAIGSRYVEGGGSTGCTWPRILLSWGANAFARMVLGLKTHDCTAGFRCYKTEVLRNLDLDTMFSTGYSFLVEMITRCERRGYTIGELPIIFENRQLGSSKISHIEILKSIQTIFRLRFLS